MEASHFCFQVLVLFSVTVVGKHSLLSLRERNVVPCFTLSFFLFRTMVRFLFIEFSFSAQQKDDEYMKVQRLMNNYCMHAERFLQIEVPKISQFHIHRLTSHNSTLNHVSFR